MTSKAEEDRKIRGENAELRWILNQIFVMQGEDLMYRKIKDVLDLVPDKIKKYLEA